MATDKPETASQLVIKPADMAARAVNDDASDATRPVLLLELNELCPPILERMMEAGQLPNFKALHARSDVHVTWTDDADVEPWVQWVTLHTGKPQEVHGARELDEGYRIETPRIWDELDRQGYSTFVFGSLNARAGSDGVFLLPDPWASRVEPTDPDYNAFHEFISYNVAEHTNRRARPDRKLVMGFARFMMRRGLSVTTVMKAVRQLAEERTSKRDLKWRRAIILDLLMWDVFEKDYRSRRPDFATFFANSAAYLQHRYWRHMQPEAYEVQPSRDEMDSYSDAIETSYRHLDELVGRAMQLVGPDGRIVFASALSQEANLRYEDIGGKFVYRPLDFDAFAEFIGAPDDITFEPVMTHQAWASCASEYEADAFGQALDDVRLDGEPVMEWRRDGARVLFWCGLVSMVGDDAVLTGRDGATAAFASHFHALGQVNNSQHCRAGALWIQRDDGKCVVHEDKLPLERVFDLITGLFRGRTARRAA